MSTPLSDALFVLAALAITIAQVMVFRSTRRGMRHDPRGAGSTLEWTYAVLPAVGLVVLLAWTWHVMHANVVHVEVLPRQGGPVL